MIPDEFHSLPVHPLAVHGAVVLVPLAALLAVLFVVPRTRAWAALPMPIVTVAALLSVIVSRASGYNFRDDLAKINPQIVEQIANHEDKATWLLYFMIVFAITAVGVYVLYRQAHRFTGAVEYAACGVLVVGGLLVAWQTYQTGEAGSKVVWGGGGASSTISQTVTVTGR